MSMHFYKALSDRVLAVAVVEDDNTWRAYISDISEEVNHANATTEVIARGRKLKVGVAEAIFPRLETLYYIH